MDFRRSNKMLKGKLLIFGIALFFVCHVNAYSGQKNSREITISSKYHLSIHIMPGSNFTYNILFMKRPATLVCWLETTNGVFVDTLFVSENAKTGNWYGHPQGQPSALPVWEHKAAGKKSDAVSGATLSAGGNFVTNVGSIIAPGIYAVKFEVNNPHDYNKTWGLNSPTRDPDYSSDNGQPSLVYQGLIEIGKISNSTVLELIGQGSADGKDGEIHKLFGITTAFHIIDRVEVRYEL